MAIAVANLCKNVGNVLPRICGTMVQNPHAEKSQGHSSRSSSRPLKLHLNVNVHVYSPDMVPGLSDQRPSLIEAHGVLFGSFLPNRSPWASIWRKHCYEVLERNCQIKAHGPAFRDLLPNGQLKIIVGKIIAIQVVKKHRTYPTHCKSCYLFIHSI